MKTCYNLFQDEGITIACCESCHEEWEELGRGMFYAVVKGEHYHLCCRVQEKVIEVGIGKRPDLPEK